MGKSRALAHLRVWKSIDATVATTITTAVPVTNPTAPVTAATTEPIIIMGMATLIRKIKIRTSTKMASA